ncbi:MAG: molybdenum hydroxylase, partial [Oscillospiraceae bacterium]|nr:molybdenum hydroxylase [Oscillospiraceae bacterium]
FAGERVLRAPADGILRTQAEIGQRVEAGETVGTVGQTPMLAAIAGVLRGLLPDGTPVTAGLKAGDVDPRGEADYCRTVSDKALAVGGGVLEAILRLTGALR